MALSKKNMFLDASSLITIFITRLSVVAFDSATNTYTEADKAAALYHVPYARNDLFVDNSADVDAICRMIQKGAERARKNGSAIIIGHCRPNTAAAFKKMVPKLKAEGIEFVYLSSLTGK